VRLVAVAKLQPAAAVVAARRAGVVDVGENRAQELLAKALDPSLSGTRWHMIGRVQTNKIKVLAPHVHLWQSVDRQEVVHELARRAPAAKLLVQVNTGREPHKGGCDPDGVARLVEQAAAHGLAVEGLMCVPPVLADPLPHFVALRSMVDKLALAECSMGMTGDFEIAIGAGATIVRVGSAIFGRRATATPGG